MTPPADDTSPSNGGCDENKIGDSCTCDDDEEGELECVGKKLSCSCGSATDDDDTGDDDTGDDDGDDTIPDDEDDDTNTGDDDTGDDDTGDDDTGDDDTEPTKDASVDARAPGRDASNPPKGNDDAGTGGGDDTPPDTSGIGTDPVLPEVSGDCPTFRDGTVMAGGRGGITIVAGEANKKGPLVFYWHGTGSTAGEYRLMMGSVANKVKAAGGILASFAGQSKLGGGADCSGTGTHNSNDFKAADVIAACAVKNHGIDPKRIYTTGCSAGGLQAGCMGMMRSNYIAAVAPNSGGITGFPALKWQSAASPAVFTMHGNASDMVIVNFGQTSAQYDKAAKSHGSFVVNCNHNKGHCAAPGDLYEGAYKFMMDHPFGASKDSPWKSGIPSGVPSYCMIY